MAVGSAGATRQSPLRGWVLFKVLWGRNITASGEGWARESVLLPAQPSMVVGRGYIPPDRHPASGPLWPCGPGRGAQGWDIRGFRCRIPATPLPSYINTTSVETSLFPISEPVSNLKGQGEEGEIPGLISL